MFASRKLPAVLAAVLCFGLVNGHSSAAPGRIDNIGAHSRGVYSANGDDIYLIAIEFGGEFTHANATAAYRQAMARAVQTNWTADITGQQAHRPGPGRHVLFAWMNSRLNEYGFVAVSLQGKTQSYRILNNGRSSYSNDWVTESWTTNGRRYSIRFADDDRGGIAWYFYRT